MDEIRGNAAVLGGICHGRQFVRDGAQPFGNALLLDLGLVGKLTLGLGEQLAGVHLDLTGYVAGLGFGGVHHSAGRVTDGSGHTRGLLLGSFNGAGIRRSGTGTCGTSC
ncbi:hypothetical protein PJL18_04105 [Paenarthrobacter nicotinovorans]|nr:hypothetical protein [Paenarthrobacter nicotinovorans]